MVTKENELKIDLPTRGMIRGIFWDIKRVTGEHPVLKRDKFVKDRDYYGCCDKYGDYGPPCTIYVRKDLKGQIAWETLWHEVFHAIGWGFKPFDMKKEVFVEITAGEVLSLCRQWGLL